jgi:MFS family permease
MTPPRSLAARLPVYYGWVMVLLAACAMVGTMPGRTNYLGVISKPLTEDPALDVSEPAFSRLNFWAVLIGAGLCLPVGWLIDRFGVRAALAVVAAGLGAVTIWMSQVADWVALFVALVLVRGLGQGALSVVSLATVGKWFTRRLGIAMAVFTVLLTFGFIAGAIWLEAAVNADGWRGPWAAVGYALFGLAVLGLLFARSTPETIGVPPDGPADSPADRPALDLPAGEALRSRAFWVFTLSGALFNLMWSAVTLYPKQLLLARGFPEADLSDLFKLFMGVLTFAGLPANLVGGWLARKVSLGKLLGVAMAAFAGSLLVFPAVGTTGAAAGYAALLGVAGGLVTVVYFAVYGSAFGRAELGLIQAAAQVVTVFASATGPVLLTEYREQFGTYDPVFYITGALALGFTTAAWTTVLPRRPA